MSIIKEIQRFGDRIVGRPDFEKQEQIRSAHQILLDAVNSQGTRILPNVRSIDHSNVDPKFLRPRMSISCDVEIDGVARKVEISSSEGISGVRIDSVRNDSEDGDSGPSFYLSQINGGIHLQHLHYRWGKSFLYGISNASIDIIGKGRRAGTVQRKLESIRLTQKDVDTFVKIAEAVQNQYPQPSPART